MMLLEFLSARRATDIVRVSAVIFVLAILLLCATSKAGLTLIGSPLGTDFPEFWGVARLTLSGAVDQIYNLPAVQAAYREVVSTPDYLLPFHYPPHFLLILTPFGLFPYFASLGLFLLLSLAVLFFALRVVFKDEPVSALLWLCAASPAVFICVLHGQVGILMAGLLVWGLWASAESPILAGLLLGLTSIKPQMALVVPLFLLMEGRWKALFYCGGATLLTMLISCAIWGRQIWLSFLTNAPFAKDILEHGWMDWEKVGSTYSALRLIGASSDVAWMGHVLVSVLAVSLFVLIRQRHLRVCGALLTAILLTPYQFSYDLVVLLPVVLLWAKDSGAAALSVTERLMLVTLWGWPVLMLCIASLTGMQPQPIVLLAALVLLWQRDKATRVTA